MTMISLIIPAYNASATIARTLDSALAQTFEDFEALVIDDGSTDTTCEIVRTFAERDSRIHLIESAENKGVSHARNLGLKEAKGKWLAPLDADDWMAPQRLERLCIAAETMKADVVLDNLRVMHPLTDELLMVTCFGDEGAVTSLSVQDLFEKDTPYASFAIGYASPLMSRAYVEERALFYNEALTLGEDFVFLAELALGGASVYIVPFADYYYSYKPAAQGQQSAYNLMDNKYDQVICACDHFLSKYKDTISRRDLRAIKNRHKLFSCLGKSRGLRLKGFQEGWPSRLFDFACTPYCLWFLFKILFLRLAKPLVSLLFIEMVI